MKVTIKSQLKATAGAVAPQVRLRGATKEIVGRFERVDKGNRKRKKP